MFRQKIQVSVKLKSVHKPRM